MSQHMQPLEETTAQSQSPSDSSSDSSIDTDGSGSGSGNGSDVVLPIVAEIHPEIFLPIYVMTGIFGAIFIIAPFLIRKGPNQGLIRCSIWLSTFSFWVLWFTMYVAQMNPLMGPRIKNTTLAWIAYSWGQIPEEEPLSPTTGGTESDQDLTTTTSTELTTLE